MKKKISQILAYAILGVLVVGLVITAVLKKSFAPNIALPTYEAGGINIAVPDTSKVDGLGKQEDYDEFVSIYNSSFELTLLYSLFSGKISREQTITNEGTKAPEYTAGFVVTFVYPEAQTLKANGKVWYESPSSPETLYKKVIFAVFENKGLASTYIYFYNDSDKNYYRLNTLANFDNLYNFISKMPMFAPDVEE